ncbi:cytochrome c biogenesis CcdA family protein [Candidatus Nitrosotenuis cloacae]|uniref:Cytochrome C biogenesis protein n=1 Tax=Candidatus Nitrosotenuis cloacae TaxID=1603555 RepID=A0A3G1B4Q4_9ARCH|nr:cytochrome c biogenesis protein CcdA [Candidatus Nitrosotenuis cloacae]AJZ76568.1 cytochrome C biogenesis protein [Candidatus Nitrosotenuis cloacae]
MTEINIAVAAVAGIGSFLAPCILPVIPAFLAYISGTTITDLQRNNGTVNLLTNRLNILINTVFFVLGFSIVFSVFGVILNSVLSSNATSLTAGFNQVGGIIIIGFGAFMILSSRINKLNFEKKILPKGGKASYPLSFVFGLAFATGWTPCIGPILGSILTLAATTPSQAFSLLLAYSLGLGIPFILMGLFFSKMTRLIRALSRHLKYYSVIMGGFIILLGVLVLTNQLATIASFPLLNDLLLG